MTNQTSLKSDPVLLFPGQGSQFVGMGKDLIEKSRAAKVRYQSVVTSIIISPGFCIVSQSNSCCCSNN